MHRSNDVTGFTLHEHNHFVAQFDFLRGTVTLNGAINIMQRPSAGSVILDAGHKVWFSSRVGGDETGQSSQRTW